LIALIVRARQISMEAGRRSDEKSQLTSRFALRRLGDLSEEFTPDPIPNSAVKFLSADGTVSQDPGE
jgi:hypothetical protein